MGIPAPSIPTIHKRLRIVTAYDLHWIWWGFSPDRWAFTPQKRWYLNTLLAYFCTVINAYSREGQECQGIDVPLDWLLERCFGPSLSRSTLKRALTALEGEFIECPRMRPGNKGKRIIFTAKLSDICLHGSKRPTAGSGKDRIVPTPNRRFHKRPERVRVNKEHNQAGNKLPRIADTLKSVMIVAKKVGVDELGRKRLFRACMLELARLDEPKQAKRNLIDWEYYRAKWSRLSFPEREGIARLEILPVFIPPKTKGQKKPKPAIIPDENPKEIRKLILQSLGVNDDN